MEDESEKSRKRILLEMLFNPKETYESRPKPVRWSKKRVREQYEHTWAGKHLKRWTNSTAGEYCHNVLVFPFLVLLNNFPIVGTFFSGLFHPGTMPGKLLGDIIAGLTVGVMLIPQGMAYAGIAQLPPEYGLYAATMGVMAYAVFGSCAQLAVGPVAIMSLLTAATVNTMHDFEDENGDPNMQYVRSCILLALVVGVMQLLLGFLRLGFVVNFLSHATLVGFTSAAALIIASSQVKALFGLESMEKSEELHVLVLNFVHAVDEFHLATFLIGLATILFLLFNKFVINQRVIPLVLKLMCWGRFKLGVKSPGALIVVLVGIFFSWWLDFEGMGVDVVGDIPAGFPPLSNPFSTLVNEIGDIGKYITGAITIGLLGYVESYSVGRQFADRLGYSIDANQELKALGVADIVASLFSGYPIAGGFGRTAVNAGAGAMTVFAGVLAAIVVIVALLVLTPLLYFLPKAVLAGIVITAVFGLINFGAAVHLWRVKKLDFLFMLVSFLATGFFGVETGIIVAVLFSFGAVIVAASRPHKAVLGKLAGSEGTYRNVKRHRNAVEAKGVKILRFDAPFFFANAMIIKDKVLRLARREKRRADLRVVVLDMSACGTIDSAAMDMLLELRRDLRALSVTILFCELNGPVRDLMRRAHAIETFGVDAFFWTVSEAVEYAEALVAGQREEEEKACAEHEVEKKLARARWSALVHGSGATGASGSDEASSTGVDEEMGSSSLPPSATEGSMSSFSSGDDDDFDDDDSEEESSLEDADLDYSPLIFSSPEMLEYGKKRRIVRKSVMRMKLKEKSVHGQEGDPRHDSSLKKRAAHLMKEGATESAKVASDFVGDVKTEMSKEKEKEEEDSKEEEEVEMEELD